MTKEELINEVATNKEYISLCKRMAGTSLGKDLFQEMLLVILEYDEKKINQLLCQRCFVLKVLSNMWNSSTSPFYYKYRKYNHEQELPINISDESENENENGVLEMVEQKLNSLHWYDKELFHLYAQEGSTRAVQRKTGIHYVSVSKVVRKVKQQLQNIK